MDSRAGLDDVEKRNSWLYRDSNSDSSVAQPVASRYTDWAIPAPKNNGVVINILHQNWQL
jgi:hypothetical protein